LSARQNSTDNTEANPDLAQLSRCTAPFFAEELVRRKGHARDGGNDVNFAMDVPKYDSPDIGDLRAKARSSTPLRPRTMSAALPPMVQKGERPTCRSAT
jgi:hypothetical protein